MIYQVISSLILEHVQVSDEQLRCVCADLITLQAQLSELISGVEESLQRVNQTLLVDEQHNLQSERILQNFSLHTETLQTNAIHCQQIMHMLEQQQLKLTEAHENLVQQLQISHQERVHAQSLMQDYIKKLHNQEQVLCEKTQEIVIITDQLKSLSSALATLETGFEEQLERLTPRHVHVNPALISASRLSPEGRRILEKCVAYNPPEHVCNTANLLWSPH